MDQRLAQVVALQPQRTDPCTLHRGVPFAHLMFGILVRKNVRCPQFGNHLADLHPDLRVNPLGRLTFSQPRMQPPFPAAPV